MLDPIQVESLTLTPIVSTKQAIEQHDLLVLDEAMKKKLVRIHEASSESVNNLTLTNRSDQPLFLLAGEVIIGGKQDRIIGKNTVIPAKTTQEFVAWAKARTGKVNIASVGLGSGGHLMGERVR